MRARGAFLTVAACLAIATPARAGDPTMSISDVQRGMHCTGYSVIQGTTIDSFDAEILDVVDSQPGEDGPRILVRVSGPAVDVTGVGPGFSGSPIYCADGQGTMRNIGAISESLGEYGNKTAFVTPIDQILRESADPPPTGPKSARRTSARRGAARPLAGPLTLTGVSPRVAALMQSAAKSVGRTLFTAPAGPLGSFPPQTLLPGSAMSVGLSSGDIALGAIGTVAYTDGDRVWAFGHPLDAAGRRSLLLQDAYVYGVINNPLATQDAQTYKLAAPGHDLGTLDNDALDAVVGLIGPLPDRTDLRIVSRDANTGKTQEIESFVADESSLGLPTGVSPMSIVGPAALTQATSTILRGSPARESGNMCVRIRLRGLKAPLGFCNRYVGAGTGGGAGQDTTPVTGTQVGMIADFTDALSLIDSFNIKPLHIERTTVTVKLERGLAQAFILAAFAPAHVHPGQRIPVRLLLQRVLGKRERVTFRLRVPQLSAGPHDLVLRGTSADTADDTFTAVVGDALGGSSTVSSSNSELGPRSVADLAKQIAQIHTYDGVRARFGGSGAPPATHAFRDKSLRISGSATVSLDVR